MTTLQLAQSWWAMTGLPYGAGTEIWSPEERMQRIAAAGFSAIHGGVRSAADAITMAALLDRYELNYIGNVVVGPDDDLALLCQHQVAAGATLINLQLSPAYRSQAWNLTRAQLALEVGARLGVQIMVETHRGRITQDPVRTLALVQEIPNLALTIDLSHYIVGSEGALDDPDFHALMDQLIARCGCIHGRISNGHQVQVALPDSTSVEELAAHPLIAPFVSYWQRGMAQAMVAQRSTIPFVCELGPPPYAQVDGSGCEFSNRWSEALRLRELGSYCFGLACEMVEQSSKSI